MIGGEPAMRTHLLLLSATALWLIGVACKSDNSLYGRTITDVAVVAGDFDDVAAPLNRDLIDHAVYEGIISTPTWDPEWQWENVALKAEGILLSRREMEKHEAVFLASGTRGLGMQQYNGLDPDDHIVSDPASAEAIRQFVGGGGTVLATDWTYDLVEAAWPDAIDFLGEDTVYDDAQRGDIADIVADVSHEALAEALESPTAAIRFDYGNFAVMEAVSEDVTVLLRGDLSYRVESEQQTVELTDVPLMVAFQPPGSTGNVVFMSFHIDAQPEGWVDAVLQTVVGDLERPDAGSVDVD